MKFHLAFLTVLLVLLGSAYSQKNAPNLHLRSGKIANSSRLSGNSIDSLNKKIVSDKAAFVIIQFEAIPSELQRKELSFQGIELLNYIPDNAYTASIKKGIKADVLSGAKIKGIYALSPQQKMDAALSAGLWPSYSVKVKGTVDVWISFPKTFATEAVIGLLKATNIEIISTEMAPYNVLALRVPTHRIFDLASQPFVEFVAPAPPPDHTLNGNSRILSGATMLNSSIANGGKGLNGEGIVVGVGDNADIQNHIDFSGRLINRNAATADFHGTHTTGTVAGAGIINEDYRGYLPKATIISQFFGGILSNAATYVQDYNMVISNNSYGASVGCAYNGIYDLTSNILDQQAFDLPFLQHVFAAGNSGNSTCGSFPQGFRTVLGGYQSAKNTISVGNMNSSYAINSGSSKGPVMDGRIKPEVTALGTNVVSPWPTNTYANASGTSMAAPAVSGGLGLLYQQYRQLNNNNDPKSALMKALICNGATDKGNAGPDFKYGFGSMNLIRSMDMLEANHYFTGNAVNGASLTHAVTIPANTAELKVMLYWHDPAASILAAKMLVNDLDLEVISPSSTLLPFLLDSTATGVNNVAVQAADHTNNIEQVSIKNPVAGNYTLNVKGTAITQNPSQEYFLVYDVIPNSIQLTYPVGGEALLPGQSARVSWDAYGDESSTFNLQYSTDGGAVWNDIAINIAAGSFAYSWTVPALNSNNVLVRVIKNASGQVSTSNSFPIIGTPTVSLSTNQCEGYAGIEWPSVTGASGYEVMILKGSEMVSVATTTSTSYILNGLSKDSIYWIGVRAQIGGKWGRRSIAISRQPNNGSCAGAISDNDLKVNALLSPSTGRKFTATELSGATIISAEIKNLDDAAATGFNIKYSIDGGVTWIAENVVASIAANSVYTHSFAVTADLSTVQAYNILIAVTNNNIDVNTTNDTLKSIVQHLPNDPINLATIFLDDIEAATPASYNNKITGINGLTRYDFENTTAVGRLRTFVNSGISYSGTKALTMDIKAQAVTSNVNYLIGTYNLSAYNAASNELRLDFQFAIHGYNRSDNNKVWIRGSDTGSWILMYDLNASDVSPGDYKLSTSLELADSLLKYAQNFSSSFQVRWSQNGNYSTTQKNAYAGTSIDNIRIYEVLADVQVISIDGFVPYNCRLSASTPVTITVHNGNNVGLTNIPLKYSVNGGAWVTETMPSLAGDATVQYTFSTLANLSATGGYEITAVAKFPSDNFPDNDTAIISLVNLPSVTSFPYLQNFEASDGGWFAEGINNSFQYGTPTSPKINKAASGQKAWKTNLSGNYNDNGVAYLYSPCFNIASMGSPALSFSVALDLENCGATKCDAAWVEYSSDGISWIKLLDGNNSATNWFNAPDKSYWSVENYTRWHVATANLPTGINSLRLRFVLLSDTYVNREGIAIDDIHVYDKTKGIYSGFTLTAAVTQTISGGTGWVDFEQNGALVASILPNNQNLGSTDVQAYINTTGVRNTGTQYYHDRNITIKPTNENLNDSVTVRFYFLDSETENLINASGCAACVKPSSAYEMGVSQYHDLDNSYENGTVGDNLQGVWYYLNSEKAFKVPFDKGYYVEYKVKEFSEFWLNTGTFTNGTLLPVTILSFNVEHSAGDALLTWIVESELNVARYEVELAQSKEAFSARQFRKIGETPGLGTANGKRQYEFTDNELFKTGIKYYRIKTINTDGSFSYSTIRSISFEEEIKIQVLPNPSTGIFNLIYNFDTGEVAEVKIIDVSGRLLKTYTIIGNGAMQKQRIDLAEKKIAPGIYLLQVYSSEKLKTLKLYKR